MFRRRPVVGRRGPSLLRTAALVGTATAVSKGVSNSMDQTAMQKQQQMEQQQATQAATMAAPATKPDFITQLQQLTQLKQVGALTEEEFQAAQQLHFGS